MDKVVEFLSAPTPVWIFLLVSAVVGGIVIYLFDTLELVGRWIYHHDHPCQYCDDQDGDRAQASADRVSDRIGDRVSKIKDWKR